MGPKTDPIWEHYSISEDHPTKASMDRMKCKYCPIVTCRNTYRSKKHLTQCQGEVPDEIRTKYAEEVAEIQKTLNSKDRPPRR